MMAKFLSQKKVTGGGLGFQIDQQMADITIKVPSILQTFQQYF
jgi:hypothetical protein